MKITKTYIEENLIIKGGFLNNRKLKNINNTIEELYLIYNECTPRLCYCGNKTKFFTFTKGYQNENCSIKCAHNRKKDILVTKEYIEENLINKKGQLDSGKTKYIKETPEELYLIYKGIKKPKCICNRNNSFRDFVKGYRTSCSSKCAMKLRRTNLEVKGKINALDSLEDFEHYKRLVDLITKKQDLKRLKDFDKRGRSDLKLDAYHLDHKFSKAEGFKQNIPPYIIGNISNLEMIPAAENCIKQDDCSITINELFKIEGN